jgi:hypothetical protein
MYILVEYEGDDSSVLYRIKNMKGLAKLIKENEKKFIKIEKIDKGLIKLFGKTGPEMWKKL